MDQDVGSDTSEPGIFYILHFFDKCTDMLCVAGMDGYFKILNPAFERVLGFSLDEMKGKPFIEFVHPEDRAATIAEVEKLQDGATTLHFENRYLCKDGSYRWLAWTSQPSLEDGLLYAVAREVTKQKQDVLALRVAHEEMQELVEETGEELKRKDEQLRQAQKLEAIGQLAGGVAHDFNNLLTGVLGNAQLLLMHLGKDDPSRRKLELIQKSGERAAALTRQLLAFSRRQVLQPVVLNVNDVIEDMRDILERLIREDVDIVTALDPGLGSVRADPIQIQQIILNLAINGQDAMPEGGTLTVETQNVSLDADYANGHQSVAPGPYVMMAVSDTGVGMDEEVQKHLFEPFFTTKGPGKGTGLGLATTYGIVKQSGGSIWVYTEPGQGAAFKVYLPRVTSAAEPFKLETTPVESGRGSETVLVVEDEEIVRAMVLETLEMSGYTVLLASSGDEALRVCESHEGPIHLLLTDVIMPEMNGLTLAKKITALRPDVQVLYMSGYTENTFNQTAMDSRLQLLEKPLTPTSVLRRVRDVLDTTDRAA